MTPQPVTGLVVVGKNPCFYPGDVRFLTAIDHPRLRRLALEKHQFVDVVVFPQRGARPVPDQCSGSDLDGNQPPCFCLSYPPPSLASADCPLCVCACGTGDTFFVSWDESLACFAPRDSALPAEFDVSSERKALTTECSVAAMKRFFVSYGENDMLGSIANTHLALSDESMLGANDPKCLLLAAEHSKSVDYAKTGLCFIHTASICVCVGSLVF
jgi:RNA-dependent RNA polymerase